MNYLANLLYKKIGDLMLRKILVLLLFLSYLSYSQEEVIDVVVMDLFGQNVTEKSLNDLTNVLERELAKTGRFNVADRMKINPILEEYGVGKKECTTVPWLVRIGKKLGVDKVVTGSVVDRGTVITVHVRTINVAMQEIDKSATEVCRNCSIDVIFLKKIKHVARVLAGLEENVHVDDSLFYFSPGPLIKLNKGAKDADISTKMGDKLFDGMWQMKSRRNCSVGIFLFGLGNTLLLIHNLLWINDHPGTMERVAISSADAVIAFLSAPFFLRANRFGKGLDNIEVDSNYNKLIYKGFKLGINISSLVPHTYDIKNLFNSRAGISIGGLLNFDLSDLIALQTELLYLKKRTESEGEYPNNEKLTMNYFAIPLLVIGKLPLKGRFEIHTVYGIAPSFLIKAKESRKTITNEISKKDIKEVRRFDLGIDFGIEFEWKLKKGKVAFELRSMEGLIDIGDHWGDSPKPKTRMASFMLGYSFY